MGLGQGLVTFAVSVAVYLLTCARTVTSDDSGELIVAAATLGVPHPPGFPFYTLMGHLFSKLPVGSVAFRLNLLSAISAAVAAAFVTLITGQVQEGQAESGRRSRKARPSAAGKVRGSLTDPAVWLRWLVPVGAGAAFAFSLTWWAYAVHAEVYTTTVALLAATLYLLLRWRRQVTSPEARSSSAGRSVVFGAGLAAGLGLGVHHTSVLLALPALAFLVIGTVGWRGVWRRQHLFGAGGLFLGLATYLYLPLAAARGPLLNWGDPSSPYDFWAHVSGRLYQGYLFYGSIADVPARFQGFLGLLARQQTLLGVAFAVLGLVAAWRRHRVLGWTLLLLALFGVGYAMVYYPSENRDAYFLTTFFALALFCALGLQQLGAFAARRRGGWSATALVLVLLLPGIGLWKHFQRNDRSRDRVSRTYVEDTLAGMEEGGLVLTRDWQLTSPYLYLRHLEGVRPDVTLVDSSALWYSWYVGYLDRTYPRLMQRCDSERDAYLELLRPLERRQAGDRDLLDSRRIGLLECFLVSSMADGRAYLTLAREDEVGERYHAVPWGLTFRLHPGRPVEAGDPPELHLEPFLNGAPYLDEVARRRIRPTYGAMLALRAAYLLQRGQAERAAEPLRRAVQVAPENRIVRAVQQGAGRLSR